jgi:hypothetical protein
MPEKRDNTIVVSIIEKRFIDFCRNLSFGKVSIEIVNGEPVHLERIIESHKFTIEGDEKRMVKDI